MSTESAAPAPAPAPEPKKAGIGKRILTYVVGLVVAGAAIYGFNYFTSDVAQAKAGDCASVTGTSNAPEYKPVECTAAEANFTIAKAFGSTSEACPADGEYVEYTQTQRRGPESKLCLAPLFVEGKCYAQDGNAAGAKAVECAETSLFKVVKVVKDAAAAQCADGEEARSYPEATLYYCVAAPV